MDFRKAYFEMRESMIEQIIANVDVINANLDGKNFIGYEREWDTADGTMVAEARLYVSPIIILRIEGGLVIGYPAIVDNVFFGKEGIYYPRHLTTDTLIDLVEMIK